MKKITILITILIFCSFHSSALLAQVTIGSGVPPAKTALLQLKDQPADSENVTSTEGGLLLPRVKLVDINTLEPFLDTSYVDYDQEKKLSIGLMVYNINESAGDNIYPGIYCWDGEKWTESTASSGESPGGGVNSQGAVKLDIYQSGFITLSGSQSYGLLMKNQNVNIDPQYITGAYPEGTSDPSSIITGTTGGNGDNNALLLEAPGEGRSNFYRMNMEYEMGNNPPAETRYFDVSVVSVGSGALVYKNSYVVPGGLNTGHIVCFQIFFPTIADEQSIGTGYRIIFGVDTAASQGLPNNIKIKIVDLTRINL